MEEILGELYEVLVIPFDSQSHILLFGMRCKVNLKPRKIFERVGVAWYTTVFTPKRL